MNMARLPTLAEVLTNQAAPPYTLSAFMAFLSHNHCLETLEFTLDASRYQTQYYSLPQVPPAPGSNDAESLRISWDRLINSYIRPGAMREVNLPSFDRDFLMRIPNTYTPPSPEALDGAVYKINELMRDSVLSPFLQSCQQSLMSNHHQQQQYHHMHQQMQPNLMFSDQVNQSNNYSNRQYMQRNTNGIIFGNTSNYDGMSTGSIPIGYRPTGAHNTCSYSSQDSSQDSNMNSHQLSQGRRISRPNSARPTSVPSSDQYQGIDSWAAHVDMDMSDAEDPITPPHTPPPGSSPTAGGQWRSKLKNQFSKMNSHRAKSREQN